MVGEPGATIRQCDAPPPLRTAIRALHAAATLSASPPTPSTAAWSSPGRAKMSGRAKNRSWGRAGLVRRRASLQLRLRVHGCG